MKNLLMLGKKRFIIHIHIWVQVSILKTMGIFLHMHIKRMRYLVRVNYL